MEAHLLVLFNMVKMLMKRCHFESTQLIHLLQHNFFNIHKYFKIVYSYKWCFPILTPCICLLHLIPEQYLHFTHLNLRSPICGHDVAILSLNLHIWHVVELLFLGELAPKLIGTPCLEIFIERFIKIINFIFYNTQQNTLAKQVLKLL